MKRLLAVTCVVWMAACSTAPSATTASGPDDTQAPATTVRPPTTSTEAPATTQRDGGDTATTGTPATAAVSSSSSSSTTTSTTTVAPTATSSTVSGTSTTSTAVATTTTEAEPALVEVEIENFRFVPAEVTVRVGDTVRWSITSGTHTTTADGAVWSSPAMARGESFAWTFDAPGTFDYFCAIHPGMRGTITVEG